MEGGLRATKIIQCCNNISVTLSAFLSNLHLAENPQRTKLIFSFVFNTSFYYNSGPMHLMQLRLTTFRLTSTKQINIGINILILMSGIMIQLIIA